MPSVEHLILQNAQIKTLGLDFSNCNRLKTLILGKTLNDKTDDTEITSDTEYYALKIEDVLNPTKEISIQGNEGSSGFSQVVLPNSNILQQRNLPKCVKTLNMGYYPNLSLTNLTV